ncbi:MAG: hypothetical protein RIQ33_216 [Bacteroidota bacterium]|jgi:uncharacterized protein YggE
MLKSIFTFTLAVCTFATFAQNNQHINYNAMASTINLSGQASKKYTPDLATIDFTISSRNKEHKVAIAELQKISNGLVTRLNKLGFTKEQIKLTAYNVNQEFDYTDNKQRLNGYLASQSLHLEFKLDMEKLSLLFKSFADEPSNDITFNYGTDFSKELKDKIKNELIQTAIHDAQAKAELIASTAKLKVIGIKDISYNVASNTPIPMFARAEMAMDKMVGSAAAAMPEVSINEVEFLENIQIVYLAEGIK